MRRVIISRVMMPPPRWHNKQPFEFAPTSIKLKGNFRRSVPIVCARVMARTLLDFAWRVRVLVPMRYAASSTFQFLNCRMARQSTVVSSLAGDVDCQTLPRHTLDGVISYYFNVEPTRPAEFMSSETFSSDEMHFPHFQAQFHLPPSVFDHGER